MSARDRCSMIFPLAPMSRGAAPDGLLGQSFRQAAAWVYSGILAALPSAAALVDGLMTMAARARDAGMRAVAADAGLAAVARDAAMGAR